MGGEQGDSLAPTGEGPTAQFLTLSKQMVREHPGVVLTLMSLLTYAYLWIHYFTFYTILDVSLDEVGYGYGDILSRSAVFLGIMIFVGWALVASMPLMSFVITSALWFLIRRPPTDEVRNGLSALSTLTSFAAMIVLTTRILSVWVGFGLSMVALIAGTISRFPKTREAGRAEIWKRSTRGSWRVLRVALALSSVAVLVVLPIGTIQSAFDVRSGRTPSGFSLVDSRPLRVVATSEATLHPMVGHCIFDLGSAEGSRVFFDPRRSAAFRVPASDIVFSSEPCE